MATILAILRFFLLAVTYGSSSALIGISSQKKFQSHEIQHQILELSDPAKPKLIDPSQVIQLSWQPRAFLYRGFLSEEECDYLISWIHGKETYTVQDDLGITVDSDNEIARRIEDRISAWTFLPKENSKPLSVLHIGPKASSLNHHYFESRYVAQAGEQPLLATVILYLSNVSQGGQLLFPQSKSGIWSDCTKNSNRLRPSVGNAILFFNLNLDASPDTSSHHARCPIIEGDLWFATKFFYLNRIRTTKNLPKSDDADCTDEDDNCPDWAAKGECERNYVFMIGSPDYFGTCRKSCNVC